ncbi:MAG: OmcA/MtrC family decaheme c-type cytochrome, partial [Chloroflexota bacterium]|nr:OmcA/MtrC family decaheme c-type cytochrome [Chloroflexota bacterium]
QGTAGERGPAGASGAAGPQGPQGSAGTQGLAGPTGPQGTEGKQGPGGAPGVTGSQGTQGAAGPQGAAGAAGVAGAQGPAGPQGLEGQAAYILADGLTVKITAVSIPADRKPVVTFTLADGKGQPLKLSDLDGYPRFTIAYVKEDAATKLTQYVNYMVADVTGAPFTYKGETKQPALAEVKARPGYDPLPSPAPTFPAAYPGLKETARGAYTYTFTTALPDGYDRNATHVVGGQATRATRAFVANPIFELLPAGGDVKVTRRVVATASCDQCHNPIRIHGGTRRETAYCVLCHTSQNTDPESGNTVELKVMAHKIHRGKNLPSVQAGTPYYIVGNALNVFDFSEIGLPQDIRNCTTCHGRPPAGMKAEDYAKLAPNADNWKLAPSRAACGACHDQIDWATGKALFAGPAGTVRDHPGGPQTNDNSCALCHAADSGKEFDASIVGAHTIPQRSTQLKGVKFELLAVGAQAAKRTEVDFAIKDNAGNFLDPNTFNSLSIVLAHPTTDYAHRISETVNTIPTPPATFTRAGVLTDLGGGNWRYTFKDPLEADWKGSVGVGMEGYRNATIKGNEGKDVVVRESNVNPVMYASLEGGAATPRRSVVDRNNCNQCHLDLGSPAGYSLHGGIRRSTEYCILCHNPNMADETRKAGTGKPLESVHYKWMIHSLHMGAERAVATLFGRAAETDEVFFPTPGTQAECTRCHKTGTYTIPLPAGVLPTTITQAGQVISVTQPIAAACKACHIARPGFDAHADTMTSVKFGEACANCHGRGKDFAVETVHKRP